MLTFIYIYIYIKAIYQIVCKQYAVPLCGHSLNAPCPYINYWPEDGSLEPKHVANYVLMTIYALCLNE